ncbi:helix-turn-helix transcriptional regulator [Clostridium sp. DJ247]|uniref:helix-turn-helix domain-containing protein n=1 Tax=Clostridium sp. DJ247 TaxID=2726188 RepID=UPI0016277B8B|nr:helix-turn-helix transcriptional regulator [Clostridium sp. DJ247]MBC2580850.1 helix-turn-helix transcriptional regulator [Clostridium sp. DJ247]
MTGLEYILELHDMSNIKLAEKFGIKTSNISRWFSGERKIPEKYLQALENIFNIPQNYFQKELTESDKLRILWNKLDKEYYTADIQRQNDICMELVRLELNIEIADTIESLNNLFKTEDKTTLEKKSIADIIDRVIRIAQNKEMPTGFINDLLSCVIMHYEGESAFVKSEVQSLDNRPEASRYIEKRDSILKKFDKLIDEFEEARKNYIEESNISKS